MVMSLRRASCQLVSGGRGCLTTARGPVPQRRCTLPPAPLHSCHKPTVCHILPVHPGGWMQGNKRVETSLQLVKAFNSRDHKQQLLLLAELSGPITGTWYARQLRRQQLTLDKLRETVLLEELKTAGAAEPPLDLRVLTLAQRLCYVHEPGQLSTTCEQQTWRGR